MADPDATVPAVARPLKAVSGAALREALPRITGGTCALERGGTRVVLAAMLVAAGDAEVRLALAGNVAAARALLARPAATPVKTAATRPTVATVTLRTDTDEIVFFTDALRVEAPPPAATVAATPPVAVDAGAEDEFGGIDPDAPTLVAVTPDALIATRRRASFRVVVTPEDAVALRLWRVEAHAPLRDRPPASRELKCELCDIGAGGLRALVHAPRIEALGLVYDQRFRVEMTWGDAQVLIDGRLRHPRATARDDASAICGIEFVHRGDDIESRRTVQKLDALLARLQRNALRKTA